MLAQHSDLASRVSYWAQQLAHRLPGQETIYHSTVSCIISQEISFKRSRAIRAQLYQMLGGKFTYDAVHSLTVSDLIRTGLKESRAHLIWSLPSTLQLEQLPYIVGVGTWTVKAVYIMTYSHPDIFLSEDAFIRKRLVQIFGCGSTPSDAAAIAEFWAGHKSAECRFLWRLQESGVQKLLSGAVLTQEDII